jgi:hypothetical protein
MRFTAVTAHICLISMILAVATHAAEPERLPADVAKELLQVYGKKLDSLAYIPAMAAYGRLRFGQLTHDQSLQDQVHAMIEAPRPAPKQPVEFAGHLVYAGAARSLDGPARDRALAAVRRAADLRFDPANPTVVRHPGPQEMSDAVFMIGPILAEAGEQAGEPKYFDAAVQYLKEMRRLRMRSDGLYQHGHLCDAAWGRGNGFPAVGTSWCLTCLPKEHPGRAELLEHYQRHIAALLKHQTADGFWRQVIDAPQSYQEFSATAMIGFALQRGVREGWLEQAKYQPAADRAWRAMCAHLQPGGKVIDVCEGTGTQKTLADYLKRKAISGVDDRAGAMALLFATERLAAGKGPE